MKKRTLLAFLALCGLSLLATEAKAPEPPVEAQNAYWRVMSAYTGVALQFEQSLTQHQRDLRDEMTKWGQKVQPAVEALNTACGVLKAGPIDQAALNKDGAIRCSPLQVSKKD